MNHNNLTGELIVSGHDHILIELDNNPKNVSVHFKHNFHRRHHHNSPCNPHQDELNAITLQIDGIFFIRIDWNVSETKEIVWSIQY